MNTIWQFATAGALRYGRGCGMLLPDVVANLGVKRPLIVTDRNVSSVAAVRAVLSATGLRHDVKIFDGCVAEPSIAVAASACEYGKSYNVDSVIGIGGGSNLDVAKVAAAVLRYGGQPADYFGFDRIAGPVLPMIAVPTTAGTGSEVSHSAVLTDTDQAIKVSTLSRWLRPAYALVDPSLTDSCPPRVSAHSGIDALVHAIEAYTNRDFSEMVDLDPQAKAYEGSYPLTRMLAAEAIRLVGRSLANVVEPPGAADARDDMALAATLAGMAFSNSGVGIVHALEYPIGALTHCSHGEGNGLLLPHVMRYNLDFRISEFATIASLLGVLSDGLSERQLAESAIEAVELLLDRIGITRRLRDFGMKKSQIPEVASKAFQIKRLMAVNQRPPQLSDLNAILEAAF